MLCLYCGRPQRFLLLARVAEIYAIRFVQLCFDCIIELAQEQVSMNKMDRIGIGYTEAALEEAALQLQKCEYCHNMVAEVLVSLDCCCACFLVLSYVYASDMERKAR